MSYGLVQQHARPAGSEHHRHRPGRGVDTVEVDERGPYGFASVALRSICIEQPSRVETSAAAGEAALPAPFALGDHHDIEPRERPNIGTHRAVGRDYEVDVVVQRDSHGDFLDGRIERARESVDLAQQGDLGLVIGGGDGARIGIACGRLVSTERPDGLRSDRCGQWPERRRWHWRARVGPLPRRRRIRSSRR